MKKLILSIIITSISQSAMSAGVFNMQIPQPDFISNDWDNDGIPNSHDNDDDNDGINDEDDSTPFDMGGQSSTPDVVLKFFTSNKITISPHESFTLSWDFENGRNLNLYDDINKTNLLNDVTGLNSISLNNVTSDKSFFLDYITGTVSLDIFTWMNNGTLCGGYTPTTSTVDFGQNFTQTRTCTTNYISNEPNSTSNHYNQNKSAVGTKPLPIAKQCKFESNIYVRYSSNITNGVRSNMTIVDGTIPLNSLTGLSAGYKYNVGDVFYHYGEFTYSLGNHIAVQNKYFLCREPGWE